jgi:hypothetical protein
MQRPEQTNKNEEGTNNASSESRKKQQQTDPQMTELKGFVDENEKLEPNLKESDNSEDEKKEDK